MSEELKDVERRLKARLDEHGRELLDDTPMSLPVGFGRPETLAEQVQRLVRGAVSQAAADKEFETFEDAEDFDVDDDFDPSTPYETFFDPILGREVTPHDFMSNQDVYRKRYAEAVRDGFAEEDRYEALRSAIGRGEREPDPAPGKVEPSQEGDSEG